MRKTTLLFLNLLFLVYINIFAQWSTDPMTNLLIDGDEGEQSVPHIAPTSSEGVYVSYYSKASGNYDMKLQYLNKQGEAKWNEPITVSSNAQNSWVSDYALATDSEDNAIITFTDARDGNLDVVVYKINEMGEQLWGENGIQLTATSDPEYIPQLAITDSNNVVIAWLSDIDSSLVLQKLNTEGEILWGNAGVVFAPDGDYYLGNAKLSLLDGEKIYFNYSHLSGPYWSPTRHVYMQLLNTNGNNLWDDEVLVLNAGGLSGLTDLSVYINEQKQYFFSWHDDRNFDNSSESYLHAIDSTGTILFETNGILLTNNAVNNHFTPTIAGETSNNEVIVMWSETDPSQNDRGVSGQKVKINGTLAWGDSGIEIEPLGSVANFSTCFMHGDSIIYFYNIAIGSFDGKCANKIDANGETVWEQESTIVNTDKAKAHATYFNETQHGQLIVVWDENRNESTDLFAQNLNYDGTLGYKEALEPELFYAEILCYALDTTIGIIDSVNRTISINMGEISDSTFIATFTLSEGATAYINETEQESGSTENVFNNGQEIKYNIVSEDSSIINTWTIVANYTIVGINEYFQNPSIYPNPANAYLTIEHNSIHSINISNLSGQRIETFYKNSNQFSINTSNYPEGLYIIEIHTTQKVYIEKIVIKH